MRIKKILIKGLYSKFNFNWKLNSAVNILSGINGSYKTTLIRLIRSLCLANLLRDICKVEFVELSFSQDISLKYKSFNDNLLNLKNLYPEDELLGCIAQDMKPDIDGLDDAHLAERKLAADIIRISRNKSDISIKDFKNNIRIDYISTFDVPDMVHKKGERTYLDKKLDDLERDYAYYLSDLSKMLLDNINEGKQMDISIAKEIFSQRDLFLSIVQAAFNDTEKKIDDNKSKLEFILKDGTTIHYESLSSGEKQFLIIMLTVLLERKQEYILLLDEPEISMHYEWQRKLIENILNLNPNCQIILTTHSPALIMDGWEQSVTNIESIKEYNG